MKQIKYIVNYRNEKEKRNINGHLYTTEKKKSQKANDFSLLEKQYKSKHISSSALEYVCWCEKTT